MTDALTRLADAVEAGTATDFQFYTFRDGLSGTVAETKTMIRAYNGSLDAAKALHEAVLHERTFVEIHWSKRYDDESRVSLNCGVDGWFAASSTPARAWLLAIIRALAQVQG